MLWELLVVGLFAGAPIFYLGAAIVEDIIKSFKKRNKAEEVEKSKEEIVHAKTDWYHIAYEKVHGFDYNMTTTMFKIHRAILDTKTEKYDRFYTVYCKEISDSYDSAKNMPTMKSKSEALHKISKTYNVIFDTMLANITKEVERKNDISADIEGVKNFAELNGDYDVSKAQKTKPEQKSKKKVVDYIPGVDLDKSYRNLLIYELDKYTNQSGYVITYYGNDMRDIIRQYQCEFTDETYQHFKRLIECIENDFYYNDDIRYYVDAYKTISKTYAETLMNNPLSGEIDL